MTPDLRPSPIAGTWYPGTPEALAESVDRHLERAEVVPPPGAIVGLVAPHAGHLYSGRVAAMAFRCLRGTAPRVVALVSPLHRPHAARVLTTAHEAYATPLGTLPVASELLGRFADRLERDHDIPVDRIRKDSEHSLEIELPFLQRVLAQPFHILPVMMRDQGRQAVEAVGHTLASVLGDEAAVLIASSDLSHFYPATIARRLDAEVMARIEAFNPHGVLSVEDEGLGYACGRGAIAAVLFAARDLGADSVQVLGYATSGDVTGDDTSVVGYGAAAIFRSDGAP